MTRVDHDAIAITGNRRQTRRINRRPGGTESTRWKPGCGATRQIAFAKVIEPTGRKTGENQFPAIRSGSTQTQIVGVEIHIWTKFHDQTCGTDAGLTQPDFTYGAQTSQPPRELQLPRNINPDPGSTTIAGSLKKGFQPSVPARTQLEHPFFGEGPGRQGTGSSGGQALGKSSALQGRGQKPGQSSGRRWRHGAQNRAG